MFRIGEFSLIAQVSGRLLRYYDEIGLLSPDHTDPHTGYRFYSAGQLPRLNRILVLKELGLSLEQIARFLDQDTPTEEIRGMLALRKAQLAQSVQTELARLHLVEARLQQIEAQGQMQAPDVVLKSVPAQPFLSLREVFSDLSAVRRVVERIAASVPTQVGAGRLGQIGLVIHSRVFEPDALDFAIGYLVTGPVPHSVRLSEERVLTLDELPAEATMATLAHVGPVSDSHQTYGQLGIWVEQQGWHISGLGRGTFLQLPPPGHEEGGVLEIQLPVSQSRTPVEASYP